MCTKVIFDQSLLEKIQIFYRVAVRRPSSVCRASETDVLWLTVRAYEKKLLHKYLALCLRPRHAKFLV